jgi:hypothetical protein
METTPSIETLTMGILREIGSICEEIIKQQPSFIPSSLPTEIEYVNYFKVSFIGILHQYRHYLQSVSSTTLRCLIGITQPLLLTFGKHYHFPNHKWDRITLQAYIFSTLNQKSIPRPTTKFID